MDTDKLATLMAVRAGHAVKRCHTMAIIGEYTVGHHTAGVMALIAYFEVNYATARLLMAALYHDVAECEFGDVPAPVKWQQETLAKAGVVYPNHEKAWLRERGLYIELTDYERSVLNIADKLELAMFCVDQRAMGNTRVDAMFWRVTGYLEERGLMENAPEPAQDLMTTLIDLYPK